MRERKLEKSHIHILQTETLSREYRVTESAQEIVDSIPCNCELYTYFYHMSTLVHFWWRGLFYNEWEDCGMLPTVKIFLEIFWDGINDRSGAVYPFESIKLC